MQIKTPVRHLYTYIKMAKIKRENDSTQSGECEEQLSGNAKWYGNLGGYFGSCININST